MKKTELNKLIRDFVKLCNENKEALGLEQDLMISPKLEMKEIENHIELLGEEIGERFGEEVPSFFAEGYTVLASAFEEYKAENPGGEKAETSGPEQAAAIKESAPPVTNKPETKPAAMFSQAPVAQGNSVPAPEQKESKKRSAPVATTKPALAADEKDKAIKKLFDLLSPEAVGTMDPATMRVVLMVMK